MSYRNRKLLDLSHEAPCFLQLDTVGCGTNPSVAVHSDMLRHGRGAGHKGHDCLAVPGCPACHAVFTRARYGKAGYEEIWRNAFERYQVWLWTQGKVKVV